MSVEIEMEFARAGDGDDYSVRDQIADLLQSAADIMRRNKNGSRDDSVAWRVADAGLLLRLLMEEPGSGWTKVKDVGGINRPTGFGAMLPAKPAEAKSPADYV